MIIRLTDGQSDYAERTVRSVDELDELNRVAFQHAGGNLYWYSVNGIPRIPARDGGAAFTRCPTCTSPEPHLHPAMQEGGEVQPCRDDFHRQVTNRNSEQMIAESDSYIALVEAIHG